MQSNEIIKLYSTRGREAYPGMKIPVSVYTLIPKNRKKILTRTSGTSADFAEMNIKNFHAMTAEVKTNFSLGL